MEMRSNDVVFETLESIHQGVVYFFPNLLQGELPAKLPILEHLIAPIISEVENDSPSSAPTLEEVFDAFFSIPNHSTPGHDGFGLGFYKSCWKVIKIDMWNAVSEFFTSKQLPKFFKASYLVLRCMRL